MPNVCCPIYSIQSTAVRPDAARKFTSFWWVSPENIGSVRESASCSEADTLVGLCGRLGNGREGMTAVRKFAVGGCDE